MKPKNKENKRQRVKLTAAEKSELFAEGVVTIIIMLLLNLSVIILYHLAILQDKSLVNGIYFLKKTMTIGPGGFHLWSWERIGVFLMGIADVVVLYWRLIRRYHQMQLRHIISELHYIANGHFDHRISFSVNTDMQKVIDSINSLVDSTVEAINEEKAIEQSKDELITNVSHDIRTPLTSIIGYLGLLKNGAVTSREDMMKYINIAYDKAEGVTRFADKYTDDDIAEFDKYAQGQLEKVQVENPTDEEKEFMRTAFLNMYANPVRNYLKAKNVNR